MVVGSGAPAGSGVDVVEAGEEGVEEERLRLSAIACGERRCVVEMDWCWGQVPGGAPAFWLADLAKAGLGSLLDVVRE